MTAGQGLQLILDATDALRLMPEDADVYSVDLDGSHRERPVAHVQIDENAFHDTFRAAERARAWSGMEISEIRKGERITFDGTCYERVEFRYGDVRILSYEEATP